MCDYQFTKNSPTSFPTGRILAKVDLGLSAYGITFASGLLILFAFNSETIDAYGADNPQQTDILNFISLPESEQFTVLGLYLGWNIYELLLAILFFFGTKLLSVGALKIWMFVTIVNCVLSLLTVVSVYMFLTSKALFVVCVMAVYMYKLFCIYTIDMFLKEIIGRRRAAAMALL